MEELHGRSRVYAQWLDNEDQIQQAIDSCPVDCIHWVYKDQLAALEYVCQVKLGRSDIAAMITNPGLATDVFAATEMFLKERRKLEESRKSAQSKQNPMQVCSSLCACVSFVDRRETLQALVHQQRSSLCARVSIVTEGKPYRQ
jgi:hypothetical protein